jgi:hypothetical protein
MQRLAPGPAIESYLAKASSGVTVRQNRLPPFPAVG